jgi:hypothetical protein
MVRVLRETEKVDVVICLSHGGLEKGKDGRFTDGDDVRLAQAVSGIDVVIGGHSHTALEEAIIVNERTPVVQRSLVEPTAQAFRRDGDPDPHGAPSGDSRLTRLLRKGDPSAGTPNVQGINQ